MENQFNFDSPDIEKLNAYNEFLLKLIDLEKGINALGFNITILIQDNQPINGTPAEVKDWIASFTTF